jgi:hypothetical protein
VLNFEMNRHRTLPWSHFLERRSEAELPRRAMAKAIE